MHAVFQHALGIIDASVELYLASIIRHFLTLHERFYSLLNEFLRNLIDTRGPLPTWFTANFITYWRTATVFPCLLLLSWGHRFLPALIVVLVDFGDFLDGVVARYWIDLKSNAAKKQSGDDGEDSTSKNSDSTDDGFQVVSTGSSQIITSWIVNQRNKMYGGFIDAICDKVFLIPCWIHLCSSVPGTRLAIIQYATLFCLILAEVASGSIRFRAYYTSGGIPAPVVKGLDFSHSAVKADHIGKAKQTFEMLGTAFFILPYMRLFGLLLLALAVPLSYESVRRKIKKRAIYVDGTVDSLDHHVLKFWIQSKGLGSKLIVGVSGGGKADLVLNACASSSVDQVIAEAPKTVDLRFMKKYGIDYVVCPVGRQGIAGEDVLESNMCLSIGEDGVAHPVTSKGAQKTD